MKKNKVISNLGYVEGLKWTSFIFIWCHYLLQHEVMVGWLWFVIMEVKFWFKILQPYFICFNCCLQIYIVLTNNMTNNKMSWLVQLCTTQLVFKTSIKLATLKLTYSKWHFWSNDNCSRWVFLEQFSQSISSWFFILAFNIEDWKFILFGIIAIIDTE